MSNSNRQKAKLLLLMEMLWQDSDEQNPLTTRQLMKRLEEKGITCDRRTLSKDMVDLNELGFEVMSVMVGHEKGYYTDDRKFSVPELRILMDAVQAAGFIPSGKSNILSKKIATLGGTYRAKLLQENTLLFNDRKHANESVFYTIDTIEEALSARQKVSFCYFDLNENKEKVYHRNGERYLVEPVGLVLVHDKYYLTALCPDRKGLSIYRIDRIDQTKMEDIAADRVTDLVKAQLPELTREAFRMYLGVIETVTLVFDDQLTGYVFDHFGEYAKVTRLDDRHCRARVKVQISPTFFGWLFQFGSAMELTEPERVVQQVRNFIAQLPYEKKYASETTDGCL